MIKLFPILLVLMLLTGCSQVTKKVIINEKSFNVEIADNQIERAQGLMFRKELEENSGMLFLFESSGKHSFWMKNTLIPLDMIWIDENFEIAYIYENAQPCEETCSSIAPDKNARYVLEINSGLVEKYNFKVGERIKII